MADRLVADAIAHQQIVRAMNGDPAIARIPNARAEHATAAHRVAHQMKVNRIFAEQAFLAQVAELRVRNSAVAVAMIHGVAAHTVRLGGFDDNVAREVRDFTARDARAEMFVSERLVQRERRTVDGDDEALLGFYSSRPARRLPITAPAVLALFRHRDNNPIADSPPRHRFVPCPRTLRLALSRGRRGWGAKRSKGYFQSDPAVARPGRRAKFHPRPIHRCSVNVHS